MSEKKKANGAGKGRIFARKKAMRQLGPEELIAVNGGTRPLLTYCSPTDIDDAG